MKVINIDETVKQVLRGYANSCDAVLREKVKKLQSATFYTEKMRADAVQKYTETRRALAFLLEISENPKKYLYSSEMKKTRLEDGKTVYDKLKPLLGSDFDRSGLFLFFRLNEAIVNHIRYSSDNNNIDEPWLYRRDKGVFDYNAERIIEFNKLVRTWDSNIITRTLARVTPARSLAVSCNRGIER